MKLKSMFTPFCLLLFHLLPAQDPVSTILNTNKVRAVINSNGSLFWDFDNGQFLAPYEEGADNQTTLKASGLWLAGIDPAGGLRGAIQRYNDGGQSDFFPGLLNQTGNESSLNDIWRVTKDEIEAHRMDFADNGQIDNPIPNIYAWPGNGNPFFEEYNNGQTLPFVTAGIAPFYDNFSNGSYDPSQGDYPVLDIRGCEEAGMPLIPSEILWFPFNDLGIHTESGFNSMHMNIQCTVFTFACEEETPYNNTIFVRYKLINQGVEPTDEVYFGVFNDFDIGNANDDFFGCDIDRATVFGYNGDDNDEGGYGTNAPAMSVDFLRGPRKVVDNELLEVPLTHVMPVELGGPAGLEYYHLLSGNFADGTPAPNNGIFYPGNPLENGANTEITAGNIPGERSTLASYGPFALEPGAVNEIVLAYTFYQEEGNTPLENVQTMREQWDEIQGLFDNCFAADLGGCTHVPVGIDELAAAALAVFPNPASDLLTIRLSEGQLKQMELVDLNGRLLQTHNWGGSMNTATLNVADLATGIYFLKVQLKNGAVAQKKIIVAR